jgi:hypothetical protein
MRYAHDAGWADLIAVLKRELAEMFSARSIEMDFIHFSSLKYKAF